MTDQPPICIAALYHFTRFEDPASLRPGLLACVEQNEVRGTLLLASEGINGTVAGSDAGIHAVVLQLKGLDVASFFLQILELLDVG